MKQYFKPLIGVFFIFFLFGLVDTYRSVLLPEIKTDFSLDYKGAALMFFLSGLGYITGNLIGGELAERYHKKVSVISGSFLILLPIILIIAVKSYTEFLVLMFFIGTGQGILNTASNLIITGFSLKRKGMALSLLHSFYGFGALVTPLFLSLMLASGMLWRRTFILLWFVYGILIFYFFIIRIPKEEPMESAPAEIHDKKKIFKKELSLYYLTVFFYMGSEVGLSAWLITFLQKNHNFSIELSSLYLTIFFICLTAGRFLGSFFLDKFHYLKSSILLLGIVLVLLVIGLSSGIKGVFLLSLTGLFYGTVFPNITVSLRNYFPDSNRSMGVFLAS
ncbi:MAG: MFS transporter, partial [bacterium]|nr:MFS transporter [bacterium]